MQGLRQTDEPARQIRAVEGVGEEEAQGREDAVEGRHRHAGLALLDLEATQILRGGRILPASEKMARRPTSRK